MHEHRRLRGPSENAAATPSSLLRSHDGISGHWRGCIAGRSGQGPSGAGPGRRGGQSRGLAVPHRPQRESRFPARQVPDEGRAADRRRRGGGDTGGGDHRDRLSDVSTTARTAAVRSDPQGCSGSFRRGDREHRRVLGGGRQIGPAARARGPAATRARTRRHPAAAAVRSGSEETHLLRPAVSQRRFRRDSRHARR